MKTHHPYHRTILVALGTILAGIELAWPAKPLAQDATSPALAAAARLSAGRQEGTGDGERGVLLLRNGEAIEGRIVRSGDRYEITMPGAEMHFRAQDVQSVCRDFMEAYQQRRLVIRLDSAQAHLDLAQWCLRNNLLQLAANEVREATAIDASHPLIPLVERRLQMASNPPETKVASQARPQRPGPTVQELDRMVRGMPPKTVENFAKIIQPVLMNQCASGGCHGQGTECGFRLLRSPIGSAPTARLTQRNLFATLQWIDFQDPGQSPLLKQPIRPHGTAGTPVFTDRRFHQYRDLQAWCYSVAQVPSPVALASYEESVDLPSALPQSSAGASRTKNRLPLSGGQASRFGRSDAAASTPNASRKRSDLDRPTTSVSDAMGLTSRESTPDLLPTTARQRPLRGVDEGAARGVADPFDPETFNRKFAAPKARAVSQNAPGSADAPEGSDIIGPTRAQEPR
jgi:hypothetical protein